MDLREADPRITLDHWYYSVKFLAVRQLLVDLGSWPLPEARPHVLVDVGAGSGILTRALFSSLDTASKIAYAVDPFYSDEQLRVEAGVRYLRELPEGVVPTHVLFIDVLEHVDDDQGLLRQWVQLAEEESVFLITVPAFQFLWSDHDRFLGHARRYTLPQVERLASDAGLVVVRARYLFASILPAAWLVRKVIEPVGRRLGLRQPRGIRPTIPVLNVVLKRLLAVEVAWGSANRLFGVTCCIAAKKPSSHVSRG